MAEAVVRIQAKIDLAFGEDLSLCGSVPVLGSWDVKNAAPMTWSDGGIWVAELSVPCGVRIELKIVARNAGGLRWFGGGALGGDNVVLETGLDRQGAQGSRFITDPLPLSLAVEDISFEAPAKCEEHGSCGNSNSPCITTGPPEVPTMASAPDAAPPPHVAAAMLAGGAAINTGRTVTYATTTTTTTVVTIDGKCVGGPGPTGAPAGQPCIIQGPGQVHPGIGMPSHMDPDAPAGGCYPAIEDSRATAALALEDDRSVEVSDERLALVASARKRNAGVAQLGCVMLAWRKPGAQEVLVAGSWDGWARQLALEPLPAGGFGLALALAPGEYECKFIADGEWLASEDLEKHGRFGNNIVRAGRSLLLPMDISPAMEPSETAEKGGTLQLALRSSGA